MRKALCMIVVSVIGALLTGCKNEVPFTPVPSAAVQDPARESAGTDWTAQDEAALQAAVEKGQILAEADDIALCYLNRTSDNYEGVFIKRGELLTLCGWEDIPVTAQVNLTVSGAGAPFVQVVYGCPAADGEQKTVFHLLDAETGGEILFESPQELLDRLGIGIVSGIPETAGWEERPKPLVCESAYPLRQEEESFVCDVSVSDGENALLGRLRFVYEFDGAGMVFTSVKRHET